MRFVQFSIDLRHKVKFGSARLYVDSLRLADISSKSTLIFNPSSATLIFSFLRPFFARSASGKSYIDHYLAIMSLSRTRWAKVEMRWPRAGMARHRRAHRS